MQDISLKILRDDMRFMGSTIDTVNKLRKFKANVHERESAPKDDKQKIRQQKKLRQFLRKQRSI